MKNQSQNLSFYGWLVLWLDVYKRYSLKQSTYSRYQHCVDKFSDGVFPLAQVSCEYLQSKVNELFLAGMSYSSMKQCIVVAREAIRKAVIIGELPVGYAAYCDLVEIPHPKPKEVHAFTMFEVRRLREELPMLGEYGRILEFMLLTGLRAGEALALPVDCIEGDLLNVYQTDYRGELQNVKTEHGNRCIPLTAEMKKLIDQSGASWSEWVFCDAYGDRLKYRTALRTFHNLLDKLGYERRGLHALRHTYASHALRCGVSPVVLAELLGHADSAFTLRRYCEADHSDKVEAVKTICWG